MPPDELGPWLKAQRLRQGLGLRQAARAAKVDASRLSDIERGVDRNSKQPTRPSREVAARLAKAYDLGWDQVAEVAGWQGPREPEDPELAELVATFKPLGTHERQLVLALVRAALMQTQKSDQDSPPPASQA